MLPKEFLRSIARLVLLSYVTQLLTPFAYACDIDPLPVGPITSSYFSKGGHQTANHFKQESDTSVTPLYKPSLADSSKARELLRGVQHSTVDQYHYKISIKGMDAHHHKLRLKISRKNCINSHSFEPLQTVIVSNKRAACSFLKSKDEEEDTVLSLFKAVSLVEYMKDGLLWHVPGFATFNILRYGKVFLDQDPDRSLLPSLNLVLKTTGKLFVQTLNVASLTLKSPETHFTHAVVADRIHMDHEVFNRGGLQVKELSGNGRLFNHAFLKFNGNNDNPALLGVRQFINGEKASLREREAKVEAQCLRITSNNHKFNNKERATISITEAFLADALEESSSFSPIINKGTFIIKDATLNRRTSNHGFWHAQSLTVNEKPFLNRSLGTLKILGLLTINSQLLNQGDLDLKELVNHGEIDTRELTLTTCLNKGTIKGKGLKVAIKEKMINEGHLFTEGKTENIEAYSQETGELINKGHWEHSGSMNLGSTQVSNSGKVVWKEGKLHFIPSQFKNEGEWLFVGMTSSQPLDILNNKTLKFYRSALSFSHLTNDATVIFSSGQYSFEKDFQNNGVISLHDNPWLMTDDENNPAHNRLLLKGNAATDPYTLGEIESQNTLTYDAKVLPKAIQVQEDVFFTPRHQANRSLSDLTKVSTNKHKKVTFYLPTITTTQNHEFTNIGHLDLWIDGPFSTNHKFTAPSLSLTINGLLSCGSSNDVLGTIAATEGPLTIRAHTVDGRFGKIYGRGQTLIQSTVGNLTIGAPLKGIDQKFKDYYGNVLRTNPNKSYFTTYVLKYAARQNIYALDEAVTYNEAYIASEDKLSLDSAADIFIDCGTTIGGKGINIKAARNIQNIAGRILSLGSTHMQGIEYFHTTKQPHIGYYHHRYRKLFRKRKSTITFPIEKPGSGPAILDSVGDVEFNFHKVTNRGSILRAQGNYFINGISISNDTNRNALSSYSEEPANYFIQYHPLPLILFFNIEKELVFTHPCIVQVGETVQMNLGNFQVTADAHAKSVIINASGSGLFKGLLWRPKTILANASAVMDLTQAIQAKARSNALLGVTEKGEVCPHFPLGTPYSLTVSQNSVMLSTKDNQHLYRFALSSGSIFNPLKNISLGLYNLYAQAALSEVAGRVTLPGFHGPSPFERLIENGTRFGQEQGKSLVTLQEVQKAPYSMILPGLSQVGDQIHQALHLIVAKEDINTVQGIRADSIGVKTAKGLTLQNMTIKAKTFFNLLSDEHLSLLSTKSTHSIKRGTQDVVQSPSLLECEEGSIIVLGKKGVTIIATTLLSLLRLIVESTEGDTTIESVSLQKTENFTRTKKGSFFGNDKVTTITRTTTTSHPSELTSAQEEVMVLSGKENKTTIRGSLLKSAAAILLQGGDLEIHADIAVHTTKKTMQKDGLFSSSQKRSVKQSATPYPTVLEAPEIHADTERATYIAEQTLLLMSSLKTQRRGQRLALRPVGLDSFIK